MSWFHYPRLFCEAHSCESGRWSLAAEEQVEVESAEWEGTIEVGTRKYYSSDVKLVELYHWRREGPEASI